MKKSVYSIVLMNDVVAAVDELASRQGTSRSNLINQILAQHVCCTTPEMHMQSVFAAMKQCFPCIVLCVINIDHH